MAGQNAFNFFLLSDAYIKETRVKMPNMCLFEKRHFLTWIDLNPGFGRNFGTFLKKFTNGRFKTLQIKIFGPKKFKLPCRESKVTNYKLPIWHF
jgi:hypothetical protein